MIALCVVAIITRASVPAYTRKVVRHVEVERLGAERIAIDTFVESLKREYSNFVVVENVLSGWTNPRNGRFNVEWIYRELLKPGLRPVATIAEFSPQPGG